MIHWECETIQLRYIIDQLKPYFEGLNLKNIEDSRKFISKQGNRIKASNLSNAKTTSKNIGGVKNQQFIKELITDAFKKTKNTKVS